MVILVAMTLWLFAGVMGWVAGAIARRRFSPFVQLLCSKLFLIACVLPVLWHYQLVLSYASGFEAKAGAGPIGFYPDLMIFAWLVPAVALGWGLAIALLLRPSNGGDEARRTRLIAFAAVTILPLIYLLGCVPLVTRTSEVRLDALATFAFAVGYGVFGVLAIAFMWFLTRVRSR